MASAEPVVGPGALWRFSRPHAFVGTLTSILGVYGIALSRAGGTTFAIPALGIAVTACLAAAVFIVGLNQFTDIAIDRVNKPYLPLASGEMTRRQATALLAFMAAVALILSVLGGRYLALTVSTSMLVGTAYSSPPWRLKRRPVPAAACIMFVRGIVIPLGLYLHCAAVLSVPGGVPVIVWVLVVFTVLFSAAIAWCKDIPDVEGDDGHGQSTFALLIGRKTVFRLSIGFLMLAFLVVVAAGVAGIADAHAPILVGAQVMFAAAILWRARIVEPEARASIGPFYMFVWNVFQVEYLAIAAASLLAC